MRGVRLEVPQSLDRERLDVVIARLAPEISRRLARRLIEEGAVLVDGQRIRVQSRLVRAGTSVEVHLSDGPAREAPEARFELLALDEAVAVADKPVGMPTEPTRQGARGTLLTALEAALAEQGADVEFLAAAHRLDTHTSGVVVFARTRAAAAHLSAQLSAQNDDARPERRYLALVEGDPPFQTARLDAALARKPDADGRIYATPEEKGGAPAVTLATVLARGDHAALLLCAPLTGRTHQIRVHLADAGLPLVDDRRYARPARAAPHPGLHALSLRVVHPTRGEPVRYTAPPPASFVQACVERGISAAALAAALAVEEESNRAMVQR